MSVQRQNRQLSDFADYRKLADAYERCHETIARVAEDVGMPRDEVERRLVELGIHEPSPYEAYLAQHYAPQELGLSPLNCTECGAEEITGHPCPECGWDPMAARYREGSA